MPHPTKKGKVIGGAEAFVALHTQINDVMRAGQEAAPEDLEKFQTYYWLAAPGSEEAVAELVKKFVEASGPTVKKAKTGAAAATVGGASSSISGRAKQSAGRSAAMRYFE